MRAVTTLWLFASVPICLAVQAYIWIAWRGLWRIVGSIPAIALIAGAVHGITKNSNLWPFWAMEFAPYAAGFAIALVVIRWITRSFHGTQEI